jgi:membrane fusion protein, multidrug efflux system
LHFLRAMEVCEIRMERTKESETANREKRRRRTRRALILAVFGAIILAGFLWVRFGPERGADAAPAERPAVPVEIFEVERMDLAETVRGVGTLEAAQMVEIRPEISGVITGIHFQEGSLVQAGQLLVELRSDKLRLQLEAQEAGLRAAEVRQKNAGQQFQRAQDLYAQGLISSEDFDAARAEAESAIAEAERLEAEVALVQEQLRDTQIRAPFAGRISERRFDLGAFVTPSDPLASLFEVSTLELVMSLPERHSGRVAPGQRVRIQIAAFPGEFFEGQVFFVSPAIAEASRDLLIKAAVPNAEGRLLPGAFADAVLTLGYREHRPVIPEEAIVATRTGYMVFVVENETARARPVETGLRQEGLVEVVAGVGAGERVVRLGHMRLNDGSAVRIVGPAALESTAHRRER